MLTTSQDAQRRATNLNSIQAGRTDSLGWLYTARIYEAQSEPLSPTTEELVDTIATGFGDSSYVQRADAHDALTELARRVKA